MRRGGLDFAGGGAAGVFEGFLAAGFSGDRICGLRARRQASRSRKATNQDTFSYLSVVNDSCGRSLRRLDWTSLMPIPINAGRSLSPKVWSRLRLRAIFDHCKWDPQCGDSPVLGRFPLFLEAQTANELAELAERLALESLAA